VVGHAGRAASKEVQARRIAVIRTLWPTGCPMNAIGERLGISDTTVAVLAKRAGLPPRHAYTTPMPKPAIFPPDTRKGPRKIAPTPEQVAKAAVAKRYTRTPAGNLIVPLTVYLAPEVVERLTARAIREGQHSFVAWVTAVLEREGKG
jgi:hypothetical protein